MYTDLDLGWYNNIVMQPSEAGKLGRLGAAFLRTLEVVSAWPTAASCGSLAPDTASHLTSGRLAGSREHPRLQRGGKEGMLGQPKPAQNRSDPI